MSSGSSGIAAFTRVRPGFFRVHPESLSSLRCTLGAVDFIQGRWVHWGAPWVWSGSSVVAGFSGRHPGGCQAHPWSLSSLGFALRAVGFIWGSWVHRSEPWGLSVSSGVAGFTGVRPGVVALIRPGSLGSLECDLGAAWLIMGRLFHWGTPFG